MKVNTGYRNALHSALGSLRYSEARHALWPVHKNSADGFHVKESLPDTEMRKGNERKGQCHMSSNRRSEKSELVNRWSIDISAQIQGKE